MQTLWFDLRDAARGLLRDRAYAGAVTLTLALTLGATTAVFSVVNGILLKPLPYSAPDRLVALHEVWHEVADRVARLEVNERHLEYWRTQTQAFDAIAQYLPLPANLTSGGNASQVSVARTSSSLFDVLAVSPVLGRALTRDDEREGQPDVAVISAALWQTRFGADPAALGTALVLDGKPFTIVGVLGADFRLPLGERLISSVDAFVPLRVEVGWLGDHNNSAIGRLRPGVTIDQARAELDLLQRQVGAIASEATGERVTLSALVTPLADSIVGRSRRALVLLLGAVLAVLLVAASNLANLSLARTFSRVRDGVIRTALGASRWRLVRRVMLEQVILAMTGAVAGIWIASISLTALVRTAPLGLPRVDEVALDVRVMIVTLAVAFATGLIVAILPAWQTASRDVQSALRASGTIVGVDPGGMRTRHALMTVQVALSVTLLAVTGLLGASLWRVLDIDVGFQSERVVSIPVSLPAARYAEHPSRIAVYDRILAGVRTVPGVLSASPTSMLPLQGEAQVNFIVADGTEVPRPDQPSANFRFVSPDFFHTLALPMEQGRNFTDSERHPDRPTPAVISALVAERLWPGQEAIGKGFSRGIEGEAGFEVVGITPDARVTHLETPPPMMVYVPYWWRSRTSTSLLVKTAVEPIAIVPPVRRVIQEIDPEIAVGQARLLDDIVASATAARRYQAQLFVAFGAVALFIATLGTYAVTAYSVSRRRRELNIRVALGARKSDILRLITGHAAAAIAGGVGLGIAGAVAVGGSVASLLYEVPPRDPLVLGVVAATVGVVAVGATVIAARQGLSMDPVAALRED